MKLAHTMIRVKDLPATLEFYCGFLGLRETRRKPVSYTHLTLPTN